MVNNDGQSLLAAYGTPINDGSSEPESAEDLSNQSNRRLSGCNRTNVGKIAALSTSLSVFGVTLYFIVSESLGSRNLVHLSLSSLGTGASIASFFHFLISPELRKKVKKFVSNWSYETLTAISQVELNVVPIKQLYLSYLPLIGGLGALTTGDVLSLASLRQSEISFCTPPQPEETLHRTCGFTTRNRSAGVKILLISLFVSAAGLTALNFTIINKTEDDLGKIGLYQDLIALFSGSVIGEVFAKILDDLKDVREGAYFERLPQSGATPLDIKIMRVSKNAFMAFTPILIGIILALQPPPNSVPIYFSQLGVGACYGAHQFLYRREFENPNSSLHQTRQVLEETQRNPLSTCQKVKNIGAKYFPSIVFFSLLTAFMIYAATNDSMRDDAGIIVLLVSTFLSFIGTNLTARYNPQRGRRFQNELSFRFNYFALGLSIFFQYVTTKIEISGRYLNQMSAPLFALALFGWGAWGTVVGNNRALSIQSVSPSALPITPPIAMIELMKLFVRILKPL